MKNVKEIAQIKIEARANIFFLNIPLIKKTAVNNLLFWIEIVKINKVNYMIPEKLLLFLECVRQRWWSHPFRPLERIVRVDANEVNDPERCGN